jgi:putative endonuclease
MKRNCIYIMADKQRNKFYIGVTNNLARRRNEHLIEGPEHYCGRHRIYDVVYVEWFDQIVRAIAREKRLKRRSRAQKLAIIIASNPEMVELKPPFFFLPTRNASSPERSEG